MGERGAAGGVSSTVQRRPTGPSSVLDSVHMWWDWVRRGASFAPVWIALVQSGCSGTEVSLDAALQDARENEDRAVEKYRGLQLRLSGSVEKSGLLRMKEGEYERTVGVVDKLEAESTEGKSGSPRAATVRVPYVVLVPNDPGLGRLLCVMEPEDRRQIDDLEKHARRTVDGWFTGFREGRTHLMLVLHGCSVSGR